MTNKSRKIANSFGNTVLENKFSKVVKSIDRQVTDALKRGIVTKKDNNKTFHCKDIALIISEAHEISI